jgi:hypothetical protein
MLIVIIAIIFVVLVLLGVGVYFLTRTSEKPDSQDFSQDSQDFSQDSQDFSQDSQDFSQDSQDFSQDSQDFSQVPQASPNLGEWSVWSSCNGDTVTRTRSCEGIACDEYSVVESKDCKYLEGTVIPYGQSKNIVIVVASTDGSERHDFTVTEPTPIKIPLPSRENLKMIQFKYGGFKWESLSAYNESLLPLEIQ